MDIKEILSKVDHTILAPDATWEQVKQVCDDAIKYHTASVCISPRFVKQAKEYVGDKMKVCTVISFPKGDDPLEEKVKETDQAVKDGADELDMVINVGLLKAKKYDEVKNEIDEVEAACRGKLLKVIIETCLLTDDEIIKMCHIVSDTKAAYIKTSTGFSTGGATPEAVKLMVENVGPYTKVKAAGGIKTLEDAGMYIKLGASRLGTSRVVAIVKQQEAEAKKK